MAQYFHINKNANIPYLRMELNNDGRHDYDKFYIALQGADAVTFSMYNEATGIYKIANAPADIIYDEESGCDERYLLQYKWKKRDTNEPGRYIGLFKITFQDKIVADGMTFPSGDLIIPIQEDLVISINDSVLRR